MTRPSIDLGKRDLRFEALEARRLLAAELEALVGQYSGDSWREATRAVADNPRPAAELVARSSREEMLFLDESNQVTNSRFKDSSAKPPYDSAINRSVVPGELVIGFRKETGDLASTVSSLLAMATANLDGTIAWTSDTIFTLNDSAGAIDLVHLQFDQDLNVYQLSELAEQQPAVAWAAPNYLYSGDIKDYTPNDPLFASQYHHALMGNTVAWDTTLGISSVIVAVTDDGLQLDHPDIAANLWVNTGETPNSIDDDGNGYVDDIHGYDFRANDGDPSPFDSGDSHGTHVAGISTGVTDNGVQIAGTAGGARVMPLRIAGADGGYTSTIMANALAYAIDNGAKIANTSYSIDFASSDPTFVAGYQYFYDQGGLHFNSAGNNNQLNPARQRLDQTLLVVSTDSADRRSSFSNYGERVDISAPGSSILSTVVGGGTASFSGTSMAAPNAAGVAALIWSAFPTYTRDQVAALLLGTADDIDSNNPGFGGLLGAGRVNSGRALNETLDAPTIATITGLPADGAVLTSKQLFDSFEMRFDQLLDPASVNSGTNFELRHSGSNGIFGDGDDTLIPLDTNTYMVGTNVLEFQILGSGLSLGDYRFTAFSGGLENPFGTDLDGNADGTAGDDFVTHFSIVQDILRPALPLGSWVYSASEAGEIAQANEVDLLTYDLDESQVLSVVVSGTTDLQTELSVLDGANNVIATVTAPAAGENVMLDLVPISVGGTYTIAVTGANNTTGTYDVDVYLNTTVEAEFVFGTSNDTSADAENLSSAFQTTPDGLARRAAVISSGSSFGNAIPFSESEPNDDGTAGGSAADLPFADDMESQFTFTDIGTRTAIALGAISSGNDVDWDFFRFEAQPGDSIVLQLQGSPSGSGTLSDPFLRLYDRDGNQIAANDDFDGLESQITFSNFQYAGDYYVVADSFSTATGTYRLTATHDTSLPNESDDWYSFTLADGESVSLALVDESANPIVEIYDAALTLVATGVSTSQLDQVIANYVDRTSNGTDETYYVRIGGALGYQMLVSVEAAFEIEQNNFIGDAQPAPGNLLGFINSMGSAASMVLGDFPGIDAIDSFCGCQPPDTHLAAGPDHVVEVVNTAIAMFDKAGNVVSAPQALTSFFSSAIVSGDTFTFDPVITYMEDVGRWVVGVLSAPTASADESDFLIAVSDTSDPTGDWTEQHRIDFGDISPNLFADYPKVGWNADALVYTFNMFGASYVDVNIVSLDKSTLIDANSTTVTSFISERPGSSFTMAPATMHGSTAGEPMWLVEESGYGGNRSDIRVVKMEDLLTASPVFTDYSIPVTPYGSGGLPAAPQPGGSRTANDARILNAEWRDGRLVAAHSVNISGETKARWYEFSTTAVAPTLAQEGLIDPGPGIATYFPSVAINAAGDIGLTYMQSSANEFTSMYVTGHAFGQTPGVLSSPALVKAGDQFFPGSRSGDYSGIFVDPVTDTFWAANEVSLGGSPDPLWSTHIGEFTVAPIDDRDFITIPATAGDDLLIETFTPFDGPFDPANGLDPVIELYGPDGVLVAEDDNSAADGRNALLQYQANTTGDYLLRVRGAGQSSGEYYVDIQGATGTNPPPLIINVDPGDGEVVNSYPTTISLDFSEAIAIFSVAATDVLIGGLPALGFTVIDGNTFAFEVDPAGNAGDGEYTIEIASGAFEDLQGQVLPGSVTSTFTLDTTGPTITSIIWNGGSFPADGVFAEGPLVVEASFSEPLFTLRSARTGLRSPGTDDVFLVDLNSGFLTFPTTVDFDNSTLAFTASFASLPEGNYELVFVSGDGAFEDQVGNDFDGEPLGGNADGTPTGDGVAGGDYFINVVVDFDVRTADPFDRIDPAGSLISASTGNVAFLDSETDVDTYQFFAHAGETITAVVRSTGNSNAILTLDAVGLAGPFVSPAAGEPARSSVLSIPADGIYSIQLSSSLAALVQLDLVLNAGLEEAVEDSADGNELDISPTRIELFGAEAARYAVVGNADPFLGNVVFDKYNDSAKFVDISTTGTPLNLSLDGVATVTTTVGNRLLPSGATTIGNNGVVTTGTGVPITYINESLPTTQFSQALLPFWDDVNGSPGNVYWQEMQIDGIDAFVVQWHDRDLFPGTPNSGIFQLQLFDSGPVLARFVYPDVDFGGADGDFGAEATIGVQFTPDDAVQASFNTAFLANNDVIDWTVEGATSDIDEYTIDLTGLTGQHLDIVLTGTDADFTAEVLELLDTDGVTVLATGTNSPMGVPASNFHLGVFDFLVPADGVYTLRVNSNVPGDYSLVVTEGMMFEHEGNNDPVTDPLRSLQTAVHAIGSVSDFSSQTYVYSDRESFVDIAGMLPTEDFEEPAIAAGQLGFADSPLDINSDDDVFDPGDILPGVVFSNLPTPGAEAMVVLGQGFVGNDSKVLGPNAFSDGTTITFTTNDVNAVGFDVWADESGNIGYVVFDIQDNLIASGDIPIVIGESTFFGITTDVSIGEVRLTSPLGELIDNVSFGRVPNGHDIWEASFVADQEVTLVLEAMLASPNYSPFNGLDPEILVIHPDGTTVVASDQDSLDGRNAFVSFVAPISGDYQIHVRAQSGSGEYLLSLVDNAPQPPTDILLSSDTVSENLDTSTGLLIGQLDAIDSNPGETFTFSLVGGNGSTDNSLFTINTDGELLLNSGVTLDFETKPSFAIRVRATDSTNLTFEKEISVQVENRVEVLTVQIGDGTAQRSRVDQLVITFDQVVDTVPEAFEVDKLGPSGGSVDVDVVTDNSSGRTVATLTFAGPLSEFGSLVDGNYALRIIGSLIEANGESLDGDANGSPGGDYLLGNQEADAFFRYYGDTSGDRIIGFSDFVQFRNSFGANAGDGNYNDFLDFDDDGIIGFVDFVQFRNRFGTELGFGD